MKDGIAFIPLLVEWRLAQVGSAEQELGRISSY